MARRRHDLAGRRRAVEDVIVADMHAEARGEPEAHPCRLLEVCVWVPRHDSARCPGAYIRSVGESPRPAAAGRVAVVELEAPWKLKESGLRLGGGAKSL